MASKLSGIPVYNAADIDWVKEVSPALGTVDHSILTHGSRLGNEWMTRIYADACDMGFYVKGSTRTLLFTLCDTADNGEEVTAWIFRASETGIQLTVWND